MYMFFTRDIICMITATAAVVAVFDHWRQFVIFLFASANRVCVCVHASLSSLVGGGGERKGKRHGRHTSFLRLS